jgi:hypothetical protein
MKTHQERVVSSKHADKLWSNALGQNRRHLRPDAHYLDMGDIAQVCKYPVQPLITHCKGIAAGNEDVPDLGIGPDIIEGLLKPGPRGMKRAVTYYTGSCAISAIGGTEVQGEQKHPVRISVYEPGDGALMFLVQWIVCLFGRADQFIDCWNNAAS